VRAYRGREPSAPMEAQEVVRLLDLLEAARVTVWLDGGWGVDALLGGETREHDDLDLVVELRDVAPLTPALVAAGYEEVAGRAPKSFVLVDAAGRQVDVHPVVFDRARGGGVYLMDDGRDWVYPAAGFEGRGEVAGRTVRCLSPEVQVLVHDGYELTDKDYVELYLLRERFGVPLPPKYAQRALAAGKRAARSGRLRAT
jgi:lincosamide nucleotidyltransferase A/C/D/E